MLKINNHKIKSFKLKYHKKILFMSDLHYSLSFSKKLEDDIINKINDIKPDYIVITGDIVDSSYFLNNKESKLKLVLFLRKISLNTKTFISLGNHDLENVHDKINAFNKYVEKWKDLIRSTKNIYLLDNDKYTDDDISVIGITLPYNYYHKSFNENVDVLISEINKHNYIIDNTKYNILLIHSPRRILTKKSINNIPLLNNIDLMLCGHMHDGVIPKFLKKLPTSIGLVAPHKTLFPKYARGKIKKNINNHECIMLVTGGITKISPSLPNLFQKLNFLYNSDIELIELRCKNE